MTKPRLSPSSVLSTASLLACATLLTTACNGHPIKPVEFDGSSIKNTGLPLDVNKKVDVLLVIDNSGSMGEEQANLAANFGPFIAQLEAAGADYRIGITTTDLGGKDCTSPATGGSLQLSSCLDRPETFLFSGADQYEVACAAHCELGDADLSIVPTTVGSGGEELARPWIQSRSGVDNLPEEVDTLAAFQCFAPQGISGCGWESPLEAMARALDNMQDPAKPEFGFLRDDALLAVLIVTDEVDCSLAPGMDAALFDADTFYAEGSNLLTSAACWNAGVACAGESPFSDCWDVDRHADGAETSDPSQAVLRPVSGYVEQLEAIAAGKAAGREILVSVIAGVPAGYSTGEAEIFYADVDDTPMIEPDLFQQKFGIGAGCQNEVGGVVQTAVPPVRLKTVAEAFAGLSDEGHRNLYSVCDDDYTPAIVDIVSRLETELPPACFTGCALDLDDATDELDYSCEVLQTIDGEQESMRECDSTASGPALPADVDVCWFAKTGADLHEQCVAQGRNLEFDLLRRPGVPVPDDLEVTALCELDTLGNTCS